MPFLLAWVAVWTSRLRNPLAVGVALPEHWPCFLLVVFRDKQRRPCGLPPLSLFFLLPDEGGGPRAPATGLELRPFRSAALLFLVAGDRAPRGSRCGLRPRREPEGGSVEGWRPRSSGWAGFLLTVFFPQLSPFAVGWLGIAALLTTVHFGFSGVLAALLHVGRPVRPLFERSLSSETLSDFWTRRWNLAYVEMNRRVFLPPLVRKVGFAAGCSRFSSSRACCTRWRSATRRAAVGGCRWLTF